ncbi:MAG: histidine phosphatase family protein [Desulfobacteraceae bacterium]|nr:histidine phosphatase family protein [Desulfobacteraceae bacterium]
MLSDNENLTLYLLRHGESEANVERVFAARKIDPPLSAIGREQSKRQSKALALIEFDACYTSPLLRARQSAEILSQGIGQQFTETKALMEVDVSILDGEPENLSQNWSIYEDIVRKWENGLSTACFPGGESLFDIEARVGAFLNTLEGMKRVLLLGHCLLFMCVIWIFTENHGPTLEDGHMGRGHLSLLVKTEYGFRLQEFNRAPPDTLAEEGTIADEDKPYR